MSTHSYLNFFESLEDRVLFDGVPDATFVLPQTDAAEPIPAQVQSIHQADVAGPVELILIDAGSRTASNCWKRFWKTERTALSKSA